MTDSGRDRSDLVTMEAGVNRQGRVVILFPGCSDPRGQKPAILGFSPREARELAAELCALAARAEARSGRERG